jgi:hypothetical protein
MKHITLFHIRTAALLLVSSITAGSAHAQWATDPTVNSLVCDAVENQLYPEIISDGSGGAIICWEDMRNTNADPNLYAQRVDANGQMQWMVDGATICDAPEYQSNPSMVSDGTGGAFITWQDRRDNTQYPHIYAQRIDPVGNVHWAVNGIPICTDSAGQYSPVILADGVGGAIIVWNDFREGGPSSNVYAQKVDASGNALWPVNGIRICNPPGAEQNISLVSDGAGGAIVIWEDGRVGNSTPNIYAQRVDSSGAERWTTNGIAICDTASCVMPHSTSDGMGGAIISWSDLRQVNAYHIYVQRIDSVGTVLWAHNGMPVNAGSYNATHHNIVSDGSGGVIIAWEDILSATTNFDILAQRLDPSGAMQWNTNGVALCTATGNQVNPTIASDGANGAVVTWGDKRGGGSFGDIYAQKISAAGAVQWTTDGVAISTAASDQNTPTITDDMNGGAIITWSDKRSNVGYDIYTQQVDSLGNLGGGVGIEDAGPMVAFRVFPNPASDRVAVRISGTFSMDAVLGLFDSTGKLIRNSSLSTSATMAYMEVGDLAAGTYALRLSDGVHSVMHKLVVTKE